MVWSLLALLAVLIVLHVRQKLQERQELAQRIANTKIYYQDYR